MFIYFIFYLIKPKTISKLQEIIFNHGDFNNDGSISAVDLISSIRPWEQTFLNI